jgi:hypothetical protein
MDRLTAEELVALAERLRDRSRQRAEVLEAIDERYAEVLAALDWLLAEDRADEAFVLADDLVGFWMGTGRIEDGDAWFQDALATDAGSAATRAKALYSHGYLVFWAGRYDMARERFETARSLAAEVGDRDVEALAMAGLGRVHLQDDVAAAISVLRDALALTEGADDLSPGRSSALHVLGVALQMSGDLLGARAVMSTRLAAGEAGGDQFVVQVESANLGMVERQLGNLDEAARLSRHVLELEAAGGDEMMIAWLINGLAAVLTAQGDHDRAARLLGFAETALDGAGGEWPPDEREQYEESIATLGENLPPDDLARLRSEGAAMSTEAALAYALDR